MNLVLVDSILKKNKTKKRNKENCISMWNGLKNGETRKITFFFVRGEGVTAIDLSSLIFGRPKAADVQCSSRVFSNFRYLLR